MVISKSMWFGVTTGLSMVVDMWIMITAELPTEPAPPRGSIFWSVPWPNAEWAQEQDRRGLEVLGDGSLWGEWWYLNTGLPGSEPDWSGARKIVYRCRDVRIFPNEFSVVSVESMRCFVGESHTLVVEGVAEERLTNEVLDGRLRPIYEQVLLEGGTHDQAMLVACGYDITIPDATFPPMGWYKLRPEYLEALGGS